jgi:hypothetical protein
MFRDLPDLPMEDRYPRMPVNGALSRTDTVLDRLFSKRPPRSDGGHTSRSGGTSVVPLSSQSHRTHLPFNAAPVVLPQNVDAGRPVEVEMLRPGPPNTPNAQELHAESVILPTSPPSMRLSRERLDTSSAVGSPPLRPPKDPRRTSHRHELAHFASAPIVPEVSASSTVSKPERIVMPLNVGERSHHASLLADMRDLPNPKTPTPASRRPAKAHADDTALTTGGARSPRSRIPMGVVAPMQTFKPEPPRQPRSKGTPRMNYRMSPQALPRPSSVPLNYSLYHLPNARSLPSTPRADQNLSRRQDS